MLKVVFVLCFRFALYSVAVLDHPKAHDVNTHIHIAIPSIYNQNYNYYCSFDAIRDAEIDRGPL